MQFRTEISPLPDLRGAISHTTPVWTIGSCFADNIGDRMLSEGFDIETNPLGTLYNPLSILNSVGALVEGRVYTPADFFPHEGKFRSYDFHSVYSRPTAEEAARMVNSRLEELRDKLPQLSTLILTFGSARCFRLKSTGQAVANCHKQHPDLFRVEDLTVETCVEAISETVALMRRACPSLSRVILTVSPIRHKAYGLHADKLSKAALLLACEKVRQSDPDNILYFPSYEIMMDDLRDYRFYAPDMVHPSEVAVDYIYDLFSRTFYSDPTIREAAARLRAFRRTLHRPR
ncbi:MAG: GSCFA domain-containing protein [Muribaculaceae bacterium]|nr:GSCFA domain-containing protein [Muribaculaceae bacterium]